MQITTKNIKKEDSLCMKSSVQEALCENSIFGVNFSDNISIPHKT